MKRIAQTVMLKDDPEIIKKYEHYHANVWPETVDGLTKCGVKRMFIYRFGRQLFMFMEVKDDFVPERDWPRYMENPKAKEWDELMTTFQETVPGAPIGTTWIEMKEVFQMDTA